MTTGENEGLIELKILSLIKQAQQQHGLRHGDYQRYHQYLSRRIHRIRKCLKFSQGDKRKVVTKVINPQHVLGDVRFFHIIIFQCERAWARYHQLQNDIAVSGSVASRKIHYSLSRLNKAVKHVLVLQALMANDGVAGKLHAKSRLELQAYIDFMCGLQKFVFREWLKAKGFLESSQQIYMGLIDTAIDEPEKKLYQSRIEELMPQIRYCSYNIGKTHNNVFDLQSLAVGHSDIVDHLLNQARLDEAQLVTEVTWLNDQVIPIRHQKSRIAITKIHEKDTILSAQQQEEHQNILESIMEVCVEIMTVLRDELRNDVTQKVAITSKSGAAPTIDQMPQHQLLITYFTFVKLVHTFRRNLLLVTKTVSAVKDAKPQELSRLYDAVIQNLQELSQLSGVCHDGHLLEDLMERIEFYKIHRCFNMAKAFMQAKKYQEACALFKRIMTKYHGECRKNLETLLQQQADKNLPRSIVDFDSTQCGIGVLLQSLTDIDSQCESCELSCRAANLLDSVSLDESGEKDREATKTAELLKVPLEERQDHYVVGEGDQQRLIALPPEFEPIPTKPFFFNLAANHIQMPCLSQKLPPSHVGKQDDVKGGGGGGSSKGIMGWLGGWGRNK